VDLRVFCYNVDGEEGYLINPGWRPAMATRTT
jgi:hypothetical protein